MTPINYLRRFYDVEEVVMEHGEIQFHVHEKGDDDEPIGILVQMHGEQFWQWRNIYGKVQSGTGFNGTALKLAAKNKEFF